MQETFALQPESSGLSIVIVAVEIERQDRRGHRVTYRAANFDDDAQVAEVLHDCAVALKRALAVDDVIDTVEPRPPDAE